MEIETETRRSPKRQQLIDGAYKVFMEHGFEGASVDEIARTAGASKATLYSYFPDKRQLFQAVVQSRCSSQGDVICTGVAGRPIEERLGSMALTFASFLYSPEAQEMFRICIAEAGRFPDLGRAFYEAGPAQARARLVEFFEDAAARGELAIEEPVVAADQFVALCKTRGFLRSLLGAPPVPEPEIRHIAREAVTTFLARYAMPRPAEVPTPK